MTIHQDLASKLLETATQIYCARAGEAIIEKPSPDATSKQEIFDHTHAIFIAALLIQSVSAGAAEAFDAAARATKSASVWSATKR